MARFDVYRNSGGSGYLLDVQATFLEGYSTRVVVPLLPVDEAPTPATTLNPVFELGGEALVMVTQMLASVPTAALGPLVTSLEHRHSDIVNALDFLFQGY